MTSPTTEKLSYDVVGRAVDPRDEDEDETFALQVGEYTDDVAVLLICPTDNFYSHDGVTEGPLEFRSGTWTEPMGAVTLKDKVEPEKIRFYHWFMGRDSRWFKHWVIYSMVNPWIGLEDSIAAADHAIEAEAPAPTRTKFDNMSHHFAAPSNRAVHYRMFSLKDQQTIYSEICSEGWKWKNFMLHDWVFNPKHPTSTKDMVITIPKSKLQFSIKDDITLNDYKIAWECHTLGAGMTMPPEAYFWHCSDNRLRMLRPDRDGFRPLDGYLKTSCQTLQGVVTDTGHQAVPGDSTTTKESTYEMLRRCFATESTLLPKYPPHHEVASDGSILGSPTRSSQAPQIYQDFNQIVGSAMQTATHEIRESVLGKNDIKAAIDEAIRSVPSKEDIKATTDKIEQVLDTLRAQVSNPGPQPSATTQRGRSPSNSIMTVDSSGRLTIFIGRDDSSAIGAFCTSNRDLEMIRLPYDWNGIPVPTEKQKDPISPVSLRLSPIFEHRKDTGGFAKKVLERVPLLPMFGQPLTNMLLLLSIDSLGEDMEGTEQILARIKSAGCQPDGHVLTASEHATMVKAGSGDPVAWSSVY